MSKSIASLVAELDLNDADSPGGNGGDIISEHSKEEFARLKELGNNDFKKKNFVDAVEHYASAIELPHLSAEDRAVLHSNRCMAFIKIVEDDKLEQSVRIKCLNIALRDAKRAKKLRPEWWRVYHRLGQVCIAKKDFAKAEKYLIEGLEKEPENKEIICEIQRCTQERVNFFVKRESRPKTSSGVLKILKPPKYPKLLGKENTSTQFDNLDLKTLEILVKNGSPYAERIYRARQHFLAATDIVRKEIFGAQTMSLAACEKYVVELSKGMQIELLLIEATSLSFDVAKYVMNQNSEFDEDARICLSVLLFWECQDFYLMIDFLGVCISKYPRNHFFLQQRVGAWNAYCLFDDAIRDSRLAHQLAPTDDMALFKLAETLALTDDTTGEAIELYKKFIDITLVDHYRIPEAYYAIVTCIHSLECKPVISRNALHKFRVKMEKYYDMGVEAEKRIPSCFLICDPTFATAKRMAEMCIKMSM